MNYDAAATQIAVVEYIEQGWQPLPVTFRGKAPSCGKEWQNFRCTSDNVESYFNGAEINIGILLGEPSHDLVDIDLDTPEAVRLAPYFLPKTGAQFGRASRRRSHYLYRASGAETRKFPLTNEAMVLELRATGCQTVFPPSVHESGEAIQWEINDDPATVEFAQLSDAAAELAAASAILRHWPTEGGRHDTVLALAGALLRNGRTTDQANDFITAIAEEVGLADRVRSGEVRRAVDDSAKKLANGSPVSGLPKLAEAIGDVACNAAAKWLGLAGDLVLSPQDPLKSARGFVADHYTEGDHHVLHHYRGEFYAWIGACYPQADGAQTRAEIYAFLEKAQTKKAGKPVPFQPNQAKVNNVLDALKAVTNLPANVEPPAWLNGRNGPPPGELVACANGLLHLPTRELLPANPAFFGLNAVNFDYDPDALDAVEFERFLDSVWPDDRESQDTLQELFGYALTCDTRQQKLFMLEGPKRSGKGTIARVLTQMIGPANICAPTLASLGTNFGLMPLIGKQLAVISDARLGGRADQQAIAERLLSISGEDALTVDRKFREPWTGRLGARFIILTNELPRLADASGALVSRFILLKLTESFYGREDLGLTDRLLAELPSILNWAIEGWRRLQERGHFIQPTSALEAIQDLEDLASPIAAFVSDRCDVGPDLEVEIGTLFGDWRDWCEDQGRKPTNRQTFGRDLNAAVRTIKIVRTREEDVRTRKYRGIGLASPKSKKTERPRYDFNNA